MLDSIEAQAINIKKVSLAEVPKTTEAPFVLERDVPPHLWKQIMNVIDVYYQRCRQEQTTPSGDGPANMRTMLFYLGMLQIASPGQEKSYPLSTMWEQIQGAIDAMPIRGTFTTFSPHSDLLVNILNLMPERKGQLPINEELLKEFNYHMGLMKERHGLYPSVLVNFMQLYPAEAAKIDLKIVIEHLSTSVSDYLERNMIGEAASALSILKMLDGDKANKHLTKPVWDALKNHTQSNKIDNYQRLRFIERLSVLSADRVEVGANGVHLIKKEPATEEHPRIPVVKAA